MTSDSLTKKVVGLESEIMRLKVSQEIGSSNAKAISNKVSYDWESNATEICVVFVFKANNSVNPIITPYLNLSVDGTPITELSGYYHESGYYYQTDSDFITCLVRLLNVSGVGYEKYHAIQDGSIALFSMIVTGSWDSSNTHWHIDGDIKSSCVGTLEMYEGIFVPFVP